MIAGDAPTVFARLLAGAVTLSFFTYAFVNMGMVSGVLPVVGIPLPFISYGGTAMVTLGLGPRAADVDRAQPAVDAELMAERPAHAAPVGVVGVGNMGLSMARRLLDRGHPVVVRDIRRRSRGRRDGCGRHDGARLRRRWHSAATC